MLCTEGKGLSHALATNRQKKIDGICSIIKAKIYCAHHCYRRCHPTGASAAADYPLSHAGILSHPVLIPLLDTVPTRSRAYMLQESTQDTERTFRSRENTRQSEANCIATRRRLRSPRRLRSMSPKSTATPLSAASGNSRTIGLGKKSQKAKENKAQKMDGFLVLEDMPDTDIIMILKTQLKP